MDVRRMQLIVSPASEVTSIPKEHYQFRDEQYSYLNALLSECVSLEYWDPKFQAWWPLIRTYLSSGTDPALTVEYYKTFLEKDGNLSPESTKYSAMYDNIVKLKRTSGLVLFEGITYTTIQMFCQQQCKFFLDNEKILSQKLYTEDILVSTINDLLHLNTWRGLMCAIQLYRHPQLDNFTYPSGIILVLQDRLGEWLEIYLKEFDEATAFVGADTKAYKWYCSKVRDVLVRTWSTALLLKDRPHMVTYDDTYSLPVSVSEELVASVNVSPAVYDNPLTEQTVWDTLSSLFFSEPEEIEQAWFAYQTYLAPTIPKSFLKNMCSNLHDFYWTVRDGFLTDQLYASFQVKYAMDPEHTKPPEDYLEYLYDRGFPRIHE